MQQYQRDFIRFAIQSDVLRFGEFKLKSGRQSPYFFNAGMFCDGDAFYNLGLFYADALIHSVPQDYDVIFGPAYKGIPLATATSIGLRLKYNQNKPIAFNRKENKNHGEGGHLVGTSLDGKRVLLIDDVITAGITVRDSVQIINEAKGQLTRILVALNRQEKGIDSNLSAIQQVKEQYGIPVYSIISLDDIITFLQEDSNAITDAPYYLEQILAYKKAYGTKAEPETSYHV